MNDEVEGAVEEALETLTGTPLGSDAREAVRTLRERIATLEEERDEYRDKVEQASTDVLAVMEQRRRLERAAREARDRIDHAQGSEGGPLAFHLAKARDRLDDALGDAESHGEGGVEERVGIVAVCPNDECEDDHEYKLDDGAIMDPAGCGHCGHPYAIHLRAPDPDSEDGEEDCTCEPPSGVHTAYDMDDGIARAMEAETRNCPVHGEYAGDDVLRCNQTGNPCGTDTWREGWECPCANCQKWLRQREDAGDDGREGDRLDVDPEDILGPLDALLTYAKAPNSALDEEVARRYADRLRKAVYPPEVDRPAHADADPENTGYEGDHKLRLEHNEAEPQVTAEAWRAHCSCGWSSGYSTDRKTVIRKHAEHSPDVEGTP